MAKYSPFLVTRQLAALRTAVVSLPAPAPPAGVKWPLQFRPE